MPLTCKGSVSYFSQQAIEVPASAFAISSVSKQSGVSISCALVSTSCALVTCSRHDTVTEAGAATFHAAPFARGASNRLRAPDLRRTKERGFDGTVEPKHDGFLKYKASASANLLTGF